MSYKCRSCGSEKVVEFLDLGSMSLASVLVSKSDKDNKVLPKEYPLQAYFCENCNLVSIADSPSQEELFIDNYNYYASFSPAIVEHASNYADEITDKLGLNHNSYVVELGSNDGYQLQFFKRKSIPCVGFEPSPGPANAAKDKKIDTIEEFFGVESAWNFLSETHPFSKGRKADLVIANNVLAHVRDLNDFLEGISLILKESGTATFENPWVKLLLDETQFDTIYHEHACYFSTHAIQAACAQHDLEITDVQYFEKLHGGMLRWSVQHRGLHMVSPNVTEILGLEEQIGLTSKQRFLDFGTDVENIKGEILQQIEEIKSQGKSIAAYGAVAKGATLTNYLGLNSETITKVYDRNINKVGNFMPGSLIEVANADELLIDMPDVVLVLAWNFIDEIISQQQTYLENGGSFLVPIPKPKLITKSNI
ncbi:MAG: class I SAM-dependent methyltransferase [Acidimicrobiia bacterium]